MMKGLMKIIIGIAVIAAVFYLSFVLTKDALTPEKVEDTNTVENVVENKVENVTENVVENKVENIAVENKVKNETEVKNTLVGKNNIYDSNSGAGTSDKKQEAINLVKEKWGPDDTVTFSCDSVTADGQYIIAVTSKEKAKVQNYFKVNLETKSVEVDY